MEIPLSGVPRVLEEGETWSKGSSITLIIDSQQGLITEIRSEDGLDPVTTVTAFTPAGEEDERAELDATRF